MAQPEPTEKVDNGCFSILLSRLKIKRKDRSSLTTNAVQEADSCPHDASGHVPHPEKSICTPNGPNTTVSPHNSGLWQEAFEAVDQRLKKYLDGSSDMQVSIQDLIHTVENQKACYENEAAKIKIGGREIIWRESATRVVDWLTCIGDLSVQFAPSPASAVWSALKVLLKTEVTRCETMAAILSCAEAILPLVRCGAVYEEVYLNIKSDEPRAPTDDLRAALVGAYAKALELLARAIRDMRQSTLQQLWVALLHSGESEDPIKPLNNAETQLEKYVQACERHQRHLDNDQSQKLLYGLGKPLRHMNVNVEALLEGMQLEKRRRMLDNLSSIKFGDQHNSRKSARAEGTGEWIFKRQEFKLWENLSCSSIFWLTGQMGAGKSVLTSRVVDRYYIEDFQTCEPIDEGFAYFYYRKTDQDLSSGNPVVQILGSLLRQLATVPHHPDHIFKDLIRLCDEMRDKMVTGDAKRFEEALRQLVNFIPKTYIVLDGLDEMDNESDAVDIIQLFINLVETSERPVKVFISSRNEDYIRNGLEKAKHNLVHLDCVNEFQPDIENYVRQSVQVMSRWSPATRHEVQTELNEKAQGMFRLAFLHLQQLQNINSEEEVRNQLRILPKGLKEAYGQLFEAQSGWDQIILKRAIMWVMYAKKTLSTEMLLAAVQLGRSRHTGELDIASPLQESAFENICRHLIVKDDYDYWKFPHASVKEYFKEEHKSWILEEAQIVMAELSILLILANYRTANPAEGDVPDPVERLKAYAFVSVIHHVQSLRGNATEFPSVSQLLDRLFRAQGDSCRSSMEYERWSNRMARSPFVEPFTISRRNILPASNPAWGIAVWGLHNISGNWGNMCLQQNLNKTNYLGKSLLSVALEFEHDDLARKLIDMDIDVNLRSIGRRGEPPLIVSLRRQCAATTKLLLESGANPNAKTRHGILCESFTEERLCPETLAILLRYGADPNARCEPNGFWENCRYGCALTKAMYSGHLEAARTMIEAGADVNLQTAHHCGSPLTAAALSGRLEAIELLVSHGSVVDSDVEGEYGSALAGAAHHGHLEAVKALIGHGADVNKKLTKSAYGGVLAAAFCGRDPETMITYLVEEAGADGRRVLTDIKNHDPRISGRWLGSEVDRREAARYLYSHKYVTTSEIQHLLERGFGSEINKFFASLELDLGSR